MVLVEFIFRIILYWLSSQDPRTSCFPELGFMLIWAGIWWEETGHSITRNISCPLTAFIAIQRDEMPQGEQKLANCQVFHVTSELFPGMDVNSRMHGC